MIPLNPVPIAPKRKLYVMAGQSNMVGHGSLSQVPDFPLAYRIWIYGYNEQWRAGAEPMSDHTGITSGNSVFFDDEDLASCGMAFGNVKAQDRLVGLIPCAKGGTSIAQWQKGGALYAAMANRINAALEEGTELAGICWYQGEEDTRTLAKSNAFKALTEQFFTDLLNDYGVPIKFCQLGPNPSLSDRPYWNAVKTSQASISMANVSMIATDDLQTISDKVHMNTASLIAIGERLAA